MGGGCCGRQAVQLSIMHGSECSHNVDSPPKHSLAQAPCPTSVRPLAACRACRGAAGGACHHRLISLHIQAGHVRAGGAGKLPAMPLPVHQRHCGVACLSLLAHGTPHVAGGHSRRLLAPQSRALKAGGDALLPG